MSDDWILDLMVKKWDKQPPCASCLFIYLYLYYTLFYPCVCIINFSQDGNFIIREEFSSVESWKCLFGWVMGGGWIDCSGGHDMNEDFQVGKRMCFIIAVVKNGHWQLCESRVEISNSPLFFWGYEILIVTLRKNGVFIYSHGKAVTFFSVQVWLLFINLCLQILFAM